MKIQLLLAVSMVSVNSPAPAAAESFDEISKFAESICGNIPEGRLTRTEIQGQVKANIGILTKIVSGSGEVSPARFDEVYKGIPFEKLPANIPTVTMCKLELAKIILARQK